MIRYLRKLLPFIIALIIVWLVLPYIIVEGDFADEQGVTIFNRYQLRKL